MIKQPKNSKLCGQCCLATILNISLDESIALIGHKHATRTKELIKHFKTNGNKLIKSNPKYRINNFINPSHLTFSLSLPSYCLCRVHFGNEKFTHWIIYKNNLVYDPCIGEYISYLKWKLIISEDSGRITSSIEIIL